MNKSSQVDKIKALKQEIKALKPLPPDLENKIMQKFRLDWNFHSNSIEGNQLTYGETHTFLMFGLTAKGKPLKDHLDIKGHQEAIRYLEDIVKEKHPLTEADIRELHKVMLKEPYKKPSINSSGITVMKEVKIGEYKSQPNHVQTITGEIFYYATPEETPAKMMDLIQWYRAELEKTDTQKEEMHPVEIAARFHYQFVRIHPFDDGNGRMARILMNLTLMRYDYPPVVIKTTKKDEYFQALRLADGGDLDSFVEYIADHVVYSLELYLKGARGENIDELSDFDKELALLKMELEAEEEKLIYTENNFDEIFEVCIKPFLYTILAELEKLDDFFVRRIQILKSFAKEGRFTQNLYFSKIDLCDLILATQLISNINLSRFEIFNNFDGFKKSSIIIEFQIRIGIFLEKNKMKIETSKNNYNYLNRYFLYYKTPPLEQYKEFAADLSKEILKEIKEKMGEKES